MEAKPKILILYTGGTIGMIKDPVTGELLNVDFKFITKHVPEINRLNLSIDSLSIDEPIDSAEITVQHWRDIATTLFENYSLYDGFVILHGTDTMSYTASALSFMLSGLRKPVIMTGSQLPIGVIRTDGKENLITALEIAAARDEKDQPFIHEVAVYFDYKLYRGNRSTKGSADLFEAFHSPNMLELASAGTEIRYHQERSWKREEGEFQVNTKMEKGICLIKLFPGLHWRFYQSVFEDLNVKGIILESFGSGNGLIDDDAQQMFIDFHSRGGITLNITQCESGAVIQGMYQAGSVFNQLGIVGGKDLTTEAAVTKMMHILANYPSSEAKELLQRSLRGELTDY